MEMCIKAELAFNGPAGLTSRVPCQQAATRMHKNSREESWLDLMNQFSQYNCKQGTKVIQNIISLAKPGNPKISILTINRPVQLSFPTTTKALYFPFFI